MDLNNIINDKYLNVIFSFVILNKVNKNILEKLIRMHKTKNITDTPLPPTLKYFPDPFIVSHLTL